MENKLIDKLSTYLSKGYVLEKSRHYLNTYNLVDPFEGNGEIIFEAETLVGLLENLPELTND